MKEIVPLIHRACKGDSEAYGIIVSRFQDMAYGYAYAILNDFHMAQDAAQEAFIEAYQCLPDLHEPLAFPSWFKKIVYKHCDRMTRGKKVATAPLESVAEMPSPTPGPEEAAQRQELSARVREAISELPVNQRVATTLFYINGYSHQEIADFLEVSTQAVKNRLHASRSRLRERMIDMVEDELKSNALPEDFTKETVEQAVAKAKELNEERQFNQAEELLRNVLTKVPEHPDVLRELNRALMQGRVYSQGRFEILPELAEYGSIILQTTDDEEIHRQMALTLLAIPAMPQAIDFIEDWITRKGVNLERLGMLAWAKGCVADYETAEKLWQDAMSLAEDAEPDVLVWRMPFIAYTLVDCFAAAGELPHAKRVAHQAWEGWGHLGPVPLRGDFSAEAGWLEMFQLAELNAHEVAALLIQRYGGDVDPKNRGRILTVRSWIDDPEEIVAEWLDWVRERVAAGEWDMIEEFRFAFLRGFRARGEWPYATKLAQAIWELEKTADTPRAKEHLHFWDAQRFNDWDAIKAKDWESADKIVRRQIKELGIESGASGLVMIASAQGTPTPREAVQAVEKKPVDKWNLWDWYTMAREAVVAGDEKKAFYMLRKALSYWTNTPYFAADMWETDQLWGQLRNHPEFKAAFDERRKRIGPVYGQLHYFPGW